MIDPTIKFKEKKNSFNVKIKISKKNVENYLTSPEDVADLKKDFFTILGLEFDRFVFELVDEQNGEEVAIQVDEILQRVVTIKKEEELSLDEEETQEEETEKVEAEEEN